MKDTKHNINPFLNVLGSVFKTIFFVIGTYFLAMILEWCGMHSWWQNESENRLSDRTQLEIQQIESSVGVGFNRHWFRNTHEYVSKPFDRLLLPLEKYLEAQQREFEDTATSVSAVVDAVVQVQQHIHRHLTVATEVFRAWLFRLLTFIFGIVSVSPLLLVGLIDGLVRREIRRWSGGRESAWLFIFASKSLYPSIAVFLGIYVLWPWSLSFAWTNCAMGICTGCALSLALATFKKYL